jgi:hypothetical protein
MKQLCGVRRQVEIEATFRQFSAIALVNLVPQQILKPPSAHGETVHLEARITLTARSAEIHHREIKGVGRKLPLQKHDL